MTTLHFTITILVDQEVITTHHVNEFKDPAEAEDIKHSMECGVFNDDYVKYHTNKIVYDIEDNELPF
jgi:hypothetical protein